MRHKRLHGLKFQSIVTPNGLIANLYGPESGLHHDSHLFTASGVLLYMDQYMNVNGVPLCIYGDLVCPQAGHIMWPYFERRQKHCTYLCAINSRICIMNLPSPFLCTSFSS
jgi:hypothetical protein